MVGYNNKFKKRKLAALISSITLASIGAQTVSAQGEIEEEVVVTGIRASLETSQNIKRQSSGVVDAITAEDIGKFPDSNIAESLQRIPGVSISRRNGEGSQVSVRGIGAGFNMVTLNGRIMPATSLDPNGGGFNASRAFDMDNIASEGIGGVEVYKTGRANIASGGVGATINLKTVRPIDNAGLRASVGAKLLNDTTNRIGSDFTPELSGLMSWSNDEQTFGVAASGSFQARDSSSAGAFVNGWERAQAYTGQYPNSIGATELETVEGPATIITNEPEVGQLIADPSDLRYFNADRERERTNAQLTMQFRPVESVTATLDYTYAEQDIYENRSELSLWFQDFPRTNLQFDDNLDSTTPVLLWEESRDPLVGDARLPRDIGLALQQQNQTNKLESFGLNIEWQATDQLALSLDAHDSSSETKPDADQGNWANVGLGANVSDNQGADFTGDLPVLLIDFNDTARPGLNGNGVLDASEVGSAVLQLNRNSNETDISQIKIDGTFEFSDELSIDFGVESRSMENLGRSAGSTTLLEGGWGVSSPGDVPEEFLDPLNYATLLDGYSTSSNNQTWFDEASGGQAVPLVQGFTGDAAVVGGYLAANRGARNGDGDLIFDTDGNKVLDPIPFSTADLSDTTNRLVEEDIVSLYAQVDYKFDLGGMPVSVLAGVRYEETEVTSTSLINLPLIRWDSNDDFVVIPGDTAQNFSETADYDHFLPNLDISIDLVDDLVARFSYSTTLARTSYDNLSTAATINGGPSSPTILAGSTPGTANSGNPGVLPIESNNIDVALEWYFDDSSYASIGYFSKDIDNFVGVAPTLTDIYGITDPTSGPRAQAAIAQLEAEGRAVDASTLFSMMAAQSVGEAFDSRTQEEWENAVDFVGNADDPLMTFSARVPQNINNSKIDGVEISGQHFFGDSGFGVQANYTMVDGDISFNNGGDPQDSQFAVVGISDTANLTLIYENYGFSSRLAYNWRDAFLDNTAVNGNEPQYTEEVFQLDLSVSYEVSEGLFVTFEGINITEEDQRQYGRSEAQLKRLEILGARYALGVRYSF